MSQLQVNEFRAAVAADPALSEQVREVMEAGGDSAALLALARERGFEFTEAEAREALAEGELSELELDLVAGGCGGGAS